MQVPKPWYRSYLNAKAAMQQDLFGTNPTMAAVLDLWHKTFGCVYVAHGSNVFLVYKFSNQFEFYFPLPRNMLWNRRYVPDENSWKKFLIPWAQKFFPRIML